METRVSSRGLRMRLVGFAIAVALTTPAIRAGDRWETLEAIHRVENPRDSQRPGPRGELGPYQFREGTWRMHTTVPFGRALDRRISDDVAVSHYEWLRRELRRNGLPETSYMIAVAWNAGITATVRGAIPRSSRDYAERVVAMADELKQRRSEFALR